MTIRELYDWAVEHDALDKVMISNITITDPLGYDDYDEIEAYFCHDDYVIMGV